MSRTKAAEVWTLVLLGLMCLFLFADQNLLAPNLTQVARDFGFTDIERDVKLGGQISLFYWIVGGTLAIGLGVLADRFPRKPLFAAVVLIGAVPCFLSGLVTTYEQLFICRVLTGIGIGGAMPLAFSLLGDFFPARSRALAASLLGLAMGLGVALGQLLAGMVGPTHGWRLPFMIVAAPNFLLAPLFLLTTREPPRGAAEAGLANLIENGHAYSARIDFARWKEIFRIRTNVAVFIQGLPGTVPWGVFFVYLNDFYAQDKGYSVERATLLVMVMGGAVILGGVAGGFMGDRVYARKPAYLPLLCGTATLLGIIPTLLLLNFPSASGPDASLTGPVVLGALTGFTANLTGPNVKAMLLNVNAPETRGSVFAMYNLADDLGRGLGPAIISVLIAGLGRLHAFNVATLSWLLCGAVLLWMVKTFPQDEARLVKQLQAQQAAEPSSAA